MNWRSLLCLGIGISSAVADDHIISINAHDWQLAREQASLSVTLPRTLKSQNGITLLRVNDEQLEQLTRFFHEQQNRCAGFFAHDSYEQGLLALQTPVARTAMLASYSIDQQNVVNPLLGQMSEPAIRGTITTLSNYQNRWYNSSYGKSSSEWIKNTWAQMAASRTDITVTLKSCSNCGMQQNVVLTIPGSDLNAEVVVIGAHADSIVSGSMSASTRAPGADDDASGVAVLTDILRVALANNFRPRRTVEFMAYAGEEVGLRGSQALANEYKNAGKTVYAVNQFDMTNYAGTGADVWVMTDNGNSAMIQFLRDLFDTYLAPTGLTRADTRCGYACSDHASWTQAGFPAAMYSEAAMSQINPNLHSANDTLAASNSSAAHSVHFAKLGLAFIYETGKTGTVTPPSESELFNNVPISNLSGAANSQKYFVVRIPTDTAISNLKITTSGGSGDADLYVKYGSKPSTSTYDCKSDGSSSAESCTISSVQAGNYYVLLNAYSAYSGVTITASYTITTPGNSYENSNDYAIPDNNTTGISSPITVTGSGAAGTVGVDVNVVHPYIGDLIVDVIAPDGTVYNVHNRSGGSADNIVKTYNVNVGTKSRNGTWKLRVRDRAASDTGYINSWKMTFAN